MAKIRELLLLRHAKSAWDTDAASDFERPLAQRGLRSAPHMGQYLSDEGLVPEEVVSSPAERARQTAILAGRSMGIDEHNIRWDRRIYHASVSTLFEVLRDSPADAGRVMLVGHNPGFEMLLRVLCDDDVPSPDDGKLMPTCAVAVLSLDCAWDRAGPGRARLERLKRPRDL